jgi:hypothetical protein
VTGARRILLVGAAVAALSPTAATAGARRDVFDPFRMPSGNIFCAYESVSGSSSYVDLRCEIRIGVKPLPPRPRSCDFDWGAGYKMNRTGRARVLCISDTVYSPKARVLQYGTTYHRDAFTCTSKTTGLRCTNASGHGFFESREHSYSF